MFELFCAAFGETRVMLYVMAWKGFPGSQQPPEVQGTLFTFLTCREVSELVTRFYRRRDACFRKL